MDARVTARSGETEAHRRLKRLAVLWAQAHGYAACAVEVTLPRCRYRADVAAYRARGSEPGVTAIFECKQVLSDLRRDNCCSSTARERLQTVDRRRQSCCAAATRCFRSSIRLISAQLDMRRTRA